MLLEEGVDQERTCLTPTTETSVLFTKTFLHIEEVAL